MRQKTKNTKKKCPNNQNQSVGVSESQINSVPVTTELKLHTFFNQNFVVKKKKKTKM